MTTGIFIFLAVLVFLGWEIPRRRQNKRLQQLESEISRLADALIENPTPALSSGDDDRPQ